VDAETAAAVALGNRDAEVAGVGRPAVKKSWGNWGAAIVIAPVFVRDSLCTGCGPGLTISSLSLC